MFQQQLNTISLAMAQIKLDHNETSGLGRSVSRKDLLEIVIYAKAIIDSVLGLDEDAISSANTIAAERMLVHTFKEHIG